MMSRRYKTSWRWILLVCFACPPAFAQQNVQFLPEVDTYLKLNSMFRVYVEAKDDQDGGDSAQAGVGPSVQLFLKPLTSLNEVRAFDLDDAKKRLLVLETGYRYVWEPNTPATSRMIIAATFNFPLKAGFSISDRNRFGLNWKDGGFTWRYRNKLTVERTVTIRSFRHIPYVAVEPFYESQYNKWSTTAHYAGSFSL